MLAVWGGGAFKERLLNFERLRAVSRGECVNSHQGLKRHSPNEQSNAKASFGARSVTNGEETEEDLVERKGPAQEEVWAKLVGKANEERIFYKWAPSDCSVRHWEPGLPMLAMTFD